MSDKIDLHISGSSAMPGGEYGTVSISGSGKLQGNVKCESIHCSGAAKVQGDVVAGHIASSGAVKVEGSVDCKEQVSISGSFQAGGDVAAAELKCSGSVRIGGGVQCGTCRVSGSFEAGKSVRCRVFRSSGGVRVPSMEAEEVKLAGRTEIPGLLNAETIRISADSDSEVGDIGCGTLEVCRDPEPRWTTFFGFRRRGGCLRVNTIEGDVIHLENTWANVVRGKQVTIGPGCQIRRVEYTDSLQAEEGTVTQSEKR